MSGYYTIRTKLLIPLLLINVAVFMFFAYLWNNSNEASNLYADQVKLKSISNSINGMFESYKFEERQDNPRVLIQLKRSIKQILSRSGIEDYLCAINFKDNIELIAQVGRKEISEKEIAEKFNGTKSDFTYDGSHRRLVTVYKKVLFVDLGISNEKGSGLFFALFIFLIYSLIPGLLIFFIVFFRTSPIIKLTKYSKQLANANFKGDGEIIKIVESVALKNRDEISDLAGMMLYMNSMVNQYVENLKEVFTDKEHIEAELNVASDIQMGILPKIFPAFPDRMDFDLHAIIQPAKNVGGDLYDYFLIDENSLFFMIGDVSDKGVPAALFMSVTKTLFKTHALSNKDKNIIDIVQSVNSQLSEDNPKLMFVTVFAGILNLETGRIEYVDGGHEAPFILRNKKKFSLLEKKGGKLPLGVMGDFAYDSNTIQLEPGEGLLLYTDGVIDATAPDNERFGESGIIDTLSQLRDDAKPEEIDRLLHQNVLSYSLGTDQFDDMAVLTLKYYGK